MIQRFSGRSSKGCVLGIVVCPHFLSDDHAERNFGAVRGLPGCADLLLFAHCVPTRCANRMLRWIGLFPGAAAFRRRRPNQHRFNRSLWYAIFWEAIAALCVWIYRITFQITNSQRKMSKKALLSTCSTSKAPNISDSILNFECANSPQTTVKGPHDIILNVVSSGTNSYDTLTCCIEQCV